MYTYADYLFIVNTYMGSYAKENSFLRDTRLKTFSENDNFTILFFIKSILMKLI